jgi:hypothetical protein
MNEAIQIHKFTQKKKGVFGWAIDFWKISCENSVVGMHKKTPNTA